MSVAATTNFNFTGFVQGKYCISYKSLFASETPLLKGTALCCFLAKMYQEEYTIASQENSELTKAQNDQQTANQRTFGIYHSSLRLIKYIFISIAIFTLGKTIYWLSQKKF